MSVTFRQIVKKPLQWFKFDNIRQKFEQDALLVLGQSILKRQWHAVVAYPDGLLADGQRRVMAAKLVGLDSLDTIIIDEPMTQTELRLAQGATAIHRADLTGWEKYQLCYELLQLNTDWGLKELAENLGIDPTSATKIMSASKVIPAIREALKEGKVSTSDVYGLSRFPEGEQQDALTARLTGEIKSRDELERAVRQRKKPSVKPDGRATRMRAILPSRIEITVSGKSLDMLGMIDALSDLLKLAKKAERDRLDVKTFEAVLKDQAKS